MKKYWLLILALIISSATTGILVYLYNNNDIKWCENTVFAVILAGMFFYGMAVVCIDLYYLESKLSKREIK